MGIEDRKWVFTRADSEPLPQCWCGQDGVSEVLVPLGKLYVIEGRCALHDGPFPGEQRDKGQ